MIVVDASATLSALLNAGPARTVFAREQLHAPQVLDFEVAAGLRRSVKVQHLEANAGWNALYVLRRLGIKRYPVFPLLARVWELQESLSVYDAVVRCPGRAPGLQRAHCRPEIGRSTWYPLPGHRRAPVGARPRGRTPPAAATTELLRLGTIPGQDQDHIG